MKRIITFLLAIIVMAMGAEAKSGAQISFTATTVDLGTIKADGGPVKFSYKLTNTGTEPLVIVSVSNGGCGCTKPTFPKAPIAPGGEGVINVTFNPKGRAGELNREIKVRSNSAKKGVVKLRFTGVILPEK